MVSNRPLKAEEPDGDAEDDTTIDVELENVRPRPQGSSPVYEYAINEYYINPEDTSIYTDSEFSSRIRKTSFIRTSHPFSKMSDSEEPMEITLSTEAKTGASGFNITGGREEGIIVSQVLKESPHSDIFCIKEGDQLLSATIYFDNITYEDALKILQQSEPYKVQFNLKRKLGKEDREKMHSIIQIKKDKQKQDNGDQLCSFKTTEGDKTVRKREHKKKRSKKDRLSWPKFQSIPSTGILGHRRSRSTSETNDEETQDTSSRVSELQEDISIKQYERESLGMELQCRKTISGEKISELENKKQAEPYQRLKEKRSLDSSTSVQIDQHSVPKTQLRKGDSLHSYISANTSKDKEDNTHNVIWRETFPEVIIVKEKTLPSPCKVSPLQRRDQTTILQSSTKVRIKELPQQTGLGQQFCDDVTSPTDEKMKSKQRKKKSKKAILGSTCTQADDISEVHSSSSHLKIDFQSSSSNDTEENKIPEDEKVSTSSVAFKRLVNSDAEINNRGDIAELQQNHVAESKLHGFQMPLFGISQKEGSILSGTEPTSEKKPPDRQQILSGWKLQMPIIKMPKLPKLQRKSFRSEIVEQSDINTNNIGTEGEDTIIITDAPILSTLHKETEKSASSRTKNIESNKLPEVLYLPDNREPVITGGNIHQQSVLKHKFVKSQSGKHESDLNINFLDTKKEIYTLPESAKTVDKENIHMRSTPLQLHLQDVGSDTLSTSKLKLNTDMIAEIPVPELDPQITDMLLPEQFEPEKAIIQDNENDSNISLKYGVTHDRSDAEGKEALVKIPKLKIPSFDSFAQNVKDSGEREHKTIVDINKDSKQNIPRTAKVKLPKVELSLPKFKGHKSQYKVHINTDNESSGNINDFNNKWTFSEGLMHDSSFSSNTKDKIKIHTDGVFQIQADINKPSATNVNTIEVSENQDNEISKETNANDLVGVAEDIKIVFPHMQIPQYSEYISDKNEEEAEQMKRLVTETDFELKKDINKCELTERTKIHKLNKKGVKGEQEHTNTLTESIVGGLTQEYDVGNNDISEALQRKNISTSETLQDTIANMDIQNYNYELDNKELNYKTKSKNESIKQNIQQDAKTTFTYSEGKHANEKNTNNQLSKLKFPKFELSKHFKQVKPQKENAETALVNTEKSETKVFLNMPEDRVEIALKAQITEPTTRILKTFKEPSICEIQLPKSITGKGKQQAEDTLEKEREISSEYVSAAKNQSASLGWGIQLPAFKIPLFGISEKTADLIDSADVSITKEEEKPESESKVQTDRLITHEATPMQEHWDVQGTGTEHSIRITTVQKTIISPESQIVDKTSPAQRYEIKREYKVEDINETFAPTEEELKPTKEMAEAATLDTGLSKRDVSLKVAEETVEKATETQDMQITEPKTQVLETVAESSLIETQLSTISTLEFGQPDQAAIPDSSDATPNPKEDIKRELEEREGETKSEYISTVAKETSSWGWGIQLPAFKIPLFGKSDKPADLIETEDASKPKEELKSETEIKEGETVIQSVSLSVETEPTTVPKEKVEVELQQADEKSKPDTDTVQSLEIPKELKEKEPEIVQKELIKEEETVIESLSLSLETEPTTVPKEKVKVELQQEEEKSKPDTDIVQSLEIPKEVKEKESEIVQKELSIHVEPSMEEHWEVQGKGKRRKKKVTKVEKTVKSTESQDIGVTSPTEEYVFTSQTKMQFELEDTGETLSPTEEELKPQKEMAETATVKTEPSETKVFLTMSEDRVDTAQITEPTTQILETVTQLAVCETQLPASTTEEGPQQAEDTQHDLEEKEREISSEYVSAAENQSASLGWGIQLPAFKIPLFGISQKPSDLIDSADVSITKEEEKPESESKVQPDRLITHEATPMQEHWDVQGTGTEHSIRITTVQKTIISPESQIVDKTSPAQLYEIKTEYKVEDMSETFAPTEEELKPTKEMAEAATLDTGLSKRDVSLKVAEETVEKATETQDTQITEPKTQVLETVAESSLSETQLSTISTLEFGQPDQAAIPDSSDATPKPKEDIKRELEERETKSEYISTVAKETSSWGWGIQLPAFKIPLFGKSDKPADLIETEDVSKPKEELKSETEIKEGETVIQSVSLSVETEPTTVPKEKVEVELQQADEKSKPDTDTVQSLEIPKELKEKEPQIVQKELIKEEETVIESLSLSLETEPTTVPKEKVKVALQQEKEKSKPDTDIVQSLEIPKEVKEKESEIVQKELRIHVEPSMEEHWEVQGKGKRRRKKVTKVEKTVKSTESQDVGVTSPTEEYVFISQTKMQFELEDTGETLSPTEEELKPQKEMAETATVKTEPSETKVFLTMSEDRVDTAQITEPTTQILETVMQLAVCRTQLPASTTEEGPHQAEDTQLDLEEKEREISSEYVSAAEQQSTSLGWGIQLPAFKIPLFGISEKTADLITKEEEKPESESKVQTDRLITHEATPMQEHWDVQGTGTEHSIRITTVQKTIISPESQIVDKTSPAQLYEIKREYKVEDISETFAPTEEELKPTKEMAEAATLDTGLRKRDVSLKVAEGPVEKATETQDTQITEPKTQVLETVAESSLSETQLSTISTLEFGQPDQAAIPDSSDATPQPKEDIKHELEEREGETKSEYISTVAKETSSWGWGIQLPAFKIPLFGKSDKPADLIETEDASKPKEELKSETEIKEEETVIESLSLSLETEPTTVPKEKVKVELQQEEEKSKPDTDIVQSLEIPKEVKEKESEIVQKELSTHVEPSMEEHWEVEGKGKRRRKKVTKVEKTVKSTESQDVGVTSPTEEYIFTSQTKMQFELEDTGETLSPTEEELKPQKEMAETATVKTEPSETKVFLTMSEDRVDTAQITEPTIQILETVTQLAVCETQLPASTTEEGPQQAEDTQLDLEEKEREISSEYVSAAENQSASLGWGIQLPAFKIPLFGISQKPADLIDSAVVSITKEKEKPESESKVQPDRLITHEATPMQEHWDVQGTGTEHSIRITTVQKTIISPESQIVDKTSPAQIYEIKREYKVEDISETFAPTEEELKPTKEMTEAATLDTGLSKRDVSLKVAEETVEKATETQDMQITEPKTQVLETVAESSLSKTQLSTFSTLEFGQPDQAAIPDSSDATPQPKEDIKRELEEREGETKSEYISTVAKETSSWGWGIQLPAFKIPLFGKSDKPADLIESEDNTGRVQGKGKRRKKKVTKVEKTVKSTETQDVGVTSPTEEYVFTSQTKMQFELEDSGETLSPTEEELKPQKEMAETATVKTEPSETKVFLTMSEDRVDTAQITEPTTQILETVTQLAVCETQLPASTTEEGPQQAEDTQHDLEEKEREISSEYVSAAENQSASFGWGIQLPAFKIPLFGISEKPADLIDSADVSITKEEEKPESESKVQPDRLITHEATPMQEHWDVQGTGTEHSIRITTVQKTIISPESQIVDKTSPAQLYEIKTEYKVEDMSETFAPTEEELKPTKEMAEAATLDTGLSKRDVSLKVAEETVEKATETQDTQITEPKTQVLETVAESSLSETQLSTISTLEFGQPDQAAIPDSSDATPQPKEDIKRELEEREGETKSEYISTVAKETSSWGWGIQLPAFKIPLFGKSDKPADLIETEDASKPKEKLKSETEIKEGETVIQSVSLSVETEPTTVPKEKVEVELQQADEKSKPDTDTVQSLEIPKELKEKEPEIVQKELIKEEETVIESLSLSLETEPTTVPKEKVKVELQQEEEKSKPDTDIVQSLEIPKEVKEKESEIVQKELSIHVEPSMEEHWEVQGKGKRRKKKVTKVEKTVKSTETQDVGVTSPTEEYVFTSQTKMQFELEDSGETLSPTEEELKPQKEMAETATVKTEPSETKVFLTMSEDRVDTAQITEPTTQILETVTQLAVCETQLPASTTEEGPQQAEDTQLDLEEKEREISSEYVSAAENQSASLGWGIQLPAFKIPLFGISEKPADLIDSAVVSITKEKEKPESESKVQPDRLITHEATPMQEHWDVQGTGTEHSIRITTVQKTIISPESQIVDKTSPAQIYEIKREYKVEDISETFAPTEEELKPTKEMTEAVTLDTGLSKRDVSLKVAEETVEKATETQDTHVTEPKTQVLETVAESSLSETQLSTFSTLEFGQPDQAAIPDSSDATPQPKEDIKRELEERETKSEYISTVAKETSSWGWGIQLPAFKIPLFGKSDKPADLIETEDVSKPKQELKSETEIKEGETVIQSVSLSVETEPTTVPKEKIEVELQQADEKSKPDTDTVQSLEIPKELKEKEPQIVQKELIKEEETVIESLSLSLETEPTTVPKEKVKVELQQEKEKSKPDTDIVQSLEIPKEVKEKESEIVQKELRIHVEPSMEEHWEVQGKGKRRRKKVTKVEKTVKSTESQDVGVTSPTEEYVFTSQTKMQFELEDTGETLSPTEEELKPQKEMAETATVKTEPSETKVFLTMSEDRVDTAQITEPTTQILETVMQLAFCETQLPASTTEQGPQQAEDTQLDLEEKEREISSEYVSAAEHQSASLGWGIQLPAFKIPLFGISEKTADLITKEEEKPESESKVQMDRLITHEATPMQEHWDVQGTGTEHSIRITTVQKTIISPESQIVDKTSPAQLYEIKREYKVEDISETFAPTEEELKPTTEMAEAATLDTGLRKRDVSLKVAEGPVEKATETQDTQITEPKTQVLETVAESSLSETQLSTFSTLEFRQPDQAAIPDSSDATPQPKEDIKRKLEERERETKSEYISTVAKETSSWGWGIQLPAFKIPLFGKSDKPADLIETEDASKPKEELKSETEIKEGETVIQSVSLSVETEPTTVPKEKVEVELQQADEKSKPDTDTVQSLEIPKELKEKESEIVQKELIKEEETVIESLSLSLETEPTTVPKEKVKVELQQEKEKSKPDTDIVQSLEIPKEVKEKESEIVQKELSIHVEPSMEEHWEVQGKGKRRKKKVTKVEKTVKSTESQDVGVTSPKEEYVFTSQTKMQFELEDTGETLSPTEEELKPQKEMAETATVKTEPSETKVFLTMSEDRVDTAQITEPTIQILETVTQLAVCETQLPASTTEEGPQQAEDTQLDLEEKEREISSEYVSAAENQSASLGWGIQLPAFKIPLFGISEKPADLIDSADVSITKEEEKPENESKVQTDRLITHEATPMQEHWDVHGTGTEHSIRITTVQKTIISPESQIVDKTSPAQLYEIKREYKVEDINETFAPTEKELKPTKEMAEAATLDTGLSKRDVSLKVAEETVEKATETQDMQITEPKTQVLETVAESSLSETQLSTISTLEFGQPDQAAIPDSSDATPKPKEDIKRELEEREGETKSVYISTVAKETSSWGWGIQLPAFKIPLFGKSDKPADLIETEDASKPKEELKSETEIKEGETVIQSVSLSVETEPTTVPKEKVEVELKQADEKSKPDTDTVQSLEIPKELKEKKPEIVQKELIKEEETVIESLSLSLETEPTTVPKEKVKVELQQEKEKSKPDTDIVQSLEIPKEVKEKESEIVQKELSIHVEPSMEEHWEVQGKGKRRKKKVTKVEKTVKSTESQDVGVTSPKEEYVFTSQTKMQFELEDTGETLSPTEEELKPQKEMAETATVKTEPSETKVFLTMSEDRVDTAQITEPTTQILETVTQLAVCETQLPASTTEEGPQQAEDTQLDLEEKEREISSEYVSAAENQSASLGWGIQLPAFKIPLFGISQKPSDLIDSAVVSITKEKEKPESESKVQPDRLITHEATPMQEHWDVQGTGTEHSIRITTVQKTIISPESQIVDKTSPAQLYEIKREYNVEDISETFAPTEEELKPTKEMAEAATLDTGLSKRDVSLKVAEETVKKATETQDTQITEPKTQVLETVAESSLSETQLSTISTLEFGQPDQAAIPDSSNATPQPKEDIKCELEEREGETKSEYIGTVAKETSSWGWGIQLPAFKIPLFGKSDKPADLIETEDASKPKEELKSETEIKEGETVIQSVSLSVETEPTTVPKEKVEVELQQADEKSKPDTDTVQSLEIPKELKEKEPEIVQKELIKEEETVIESLSLSLETEPTTVPKEKVKVELQQEEEKSKPDTDIVQSLEIPKEVKEKESEIVQKELRIHVEPSMEEHWEVQGKGKRRRKKVTKVEKTVKSTESQDVGLTSPTEEYVFTSQRKMQFELEDTGETLSPTEEELKPQKEMAEIATVKTEPSETKVFLTMSEDRVDTAQITEPTTQILETVMQLAVCRTQLPASTTEEGPHQAEDTQLDLEEKEREISSEYVSAAEQQSTSFGWGIQLPAFKIPLFGISEKTADLITKEEEKPESESKVQTDRLITHEATPMQEHWDVQGFDSKANSKNRIFLSLEL
eukprot:XP_017951912.1 PREDICTED: titin [Xenopus tropicalis]